MTDKHCPVCGLSFTDTSRGVIVGEKPYHDKCISELRCDKCGVIMGYFTANAIIEQRNSKMFCATCARKVRYQ